MSAPNKIYAVERDNTLGVRKLYASYTPAKDDDGEYEEYIRKDALLEWAKETYLTENASAIRKVCFKQLIEKLQSL